MPGLKMDQFEKKKKLIRNMCGLKMDQLLKNKTNPKERR